jgi:hypothetical protein
LNALKEKKLVELKNRLSQLNGLGENIFPQNFVQPSEETYFGEGIF